MATKSARNAAPYLLLFRNTGPETHQHLSPEERQQLVTLRAVQNSQVEAAGKVRASLDTVATATAQLADSGNADARTIVEELRKRGITINPATPK